MARLSLKKFIKELKKRNLLITNKKSKKIIGYKSRGDTHKVFVWAQNNYGPDGFADCVNHFSRLDKRENGRGK
jgi:hypothetical protein